MNKNDKKHNFVRILMVNQDQNSDPLSESKR